MPSGPSDVQFLYLTTTGRTTGLPREIEIWFVTAGGRYYLLAEHHRGAHWVRNIECDPRVKIRVDGRESTATARVLDEAADSESWKLAQELARRKYGWGDGLPVEVTPGESL
jgi:deazaflavin-dependent oxidoreductase (nitroreductase family)